MNEWIKVECENMLSILIHSYLFLPVNLFYGCKVECTLALWTNYAKMEKLKEVYKVQKNKIFRKFNVGKSLETRISFTPVTHQSSI